MKAKHKTTTGAVLRTKERKKRLTDKEKPPDVFKFVDDVSALFISKSKW